MDFTKTAKDAVKVNAAAVMVVTTAAKAGVRAAVVSAVITPGRSADAMLARSAAWVAAKVAEWENAVKAAARAADAACSVPAI